jgi:stage V sporulation protein G
MIAWRFGVRIIEGDSGYFVSMPTRRREDGKFMDLVHPINAQTRKMIDDSVLTEYQRLIGKSNRPVRPTRSRGVTRGRLWT